MRSTYGRLQGFLGCITLGLFVFVISPTTIAQTSADSTSEKSSEIKTSASPTTPVATPEEPTVEAASRPSPTDAAPPDAASVNATGADTSASDVKATSGSASAAPTPAPSSASAPPVAQPAICRRIIEAEVVVLGQPYLLNRLGASMPNALVYALRGDVKGTTPTDVQLKPTKRARPIVLRANQGDCLKIKLFNLVGPTSVATTTPQLSLHAQGMQLVNSIADDGSFVGVNNSSLADPSVSLADPSGAAKTYTIFAEREGTFLLYSEGDSNTPGEQLFQSLFGAINVQPAGAEWYRSQVAQEDLELAIDRTKGVNGRTSLGQPIINYNALYPANYTKDPTRACTPILKMADVSYSIVPGPRGTRTCRAVRGNMRLYHTDLTAIITGPKAGRFPGATKNPATPDPPCNRPVRPGTAFDPLFCTNPASPDRKQPYREVTVIYHEVFPSANQAFPIFRPQTGSPATSNPAFPVTIAGQDAFAINYGTGGIGAEIYANRIGVGPMANCVDCKFEEFFLSAWSVGDPAMVVDVPANYAPPLPSPPCAPNNLTPANSATCLANTTQDPSNPPKATKAFFPDDPSNVYHTYLNDHVKFRILHGGTGVTHVHHQHAHQWIQSPNSSEGSYLDSQFISPGASYTLEMVYNGSGNRNKTLGDSIFHCHFYPHFAAGMWAMWRVHDVFEQGTQLDANGIPVKGARALPDAEILTGTAIPAVVPMPTMPMPLMPSSVFIDNGQIVFGTPAAPDSTGANVKVNPGYPFFIPGIAGMRPPHPPLDFAPDGAGGHFDGGLPRHVNTGGTVTNQLKFKTAPFTDWSKDFLTLTSKQLPEDGTPVEKVAIAFNSKRCQKTFLPNGSGLNPFGPQNYPECAPAANQAQFIVNGLPNGAQSGAPFADPAVLDDGKPAGKKLVYKAAAVERDVVYNQQGWHFPQHRMLTLWQDVVPTINGSRPPEPLFFRANSEEHFIEYWHTNLVPNYYQLDSFQVKTPTDILGQHIHLVKFDVTSSDGAGNGYNYEDGTFSPDEVREIIHAINAPGGAWDRSQCATCPTNLRPAQPPPTEICGTTTPAQCKPGGAWIGAQTTIQRWYADPFRDNDGQDNTVRTVFTHDHFGPSTHQQVGLYAGLVVEPKESSWRSNEGDVPLNTRTDGGPTTWQARILTKNPADSYREFALEFQDFTLAYAPAPGGAINPPGTPQLVSTGGQPPPGTQTVNYYNAPVPFRAQGACQDLSYLFDSKCLPASNAKPNGDPKTPLMRAYENDKVQVRLLVGAHTFSHFFTIGGPKWLFEPSWSNSGFRSSQGMGLSEHFELLFNVPPSSVGTSTRKCPEANSKSSGDCVDYLYIPSEDNFGITNGLWGLLRAYSPAKPFNELKPLPSNPLGPTSNMAYQTCPPNQPADKIRTYNITAIDAQTFVPGGGIVFNSRNASDDIRGAGLMYVFSEEIDPTTRKVVGPIEPLILRANAGDCIVVNLSNGFGPTSAPFTQTRRWPQPFTNLPAQIGASKYAGLHPQLLSYDGYSDGGLNVGWNPKAQSVPLGQKITYNWYAGNISRNSTGGLVYTPVEFGSLNLMPPDPIMQHQWTLFGGMVIEPAGSKWTCDAEDIDGKKIEVACQPGPDLDLPKLKQLKNYTRASATVTPASGPAFREFVAMMSEDLILRQDNRSGINYRTEPTYYRYGHTNPGPNPFPPGPPFAPPDPPGANNSCALSNALVGGGDPQTPIFTAKAGTPVRFRLMHPQGTGTAQVFALNGHVWQREPYINNSTAIGNNQLSQWLGSHDSYGGTDHYDLVIDKAGGANAVPGDYLYTSFVPNQNSYGSWGVFRVLDKNGNKVAGNPSCPPTLNWPPMQPKGELDRFIRPPFRKAP
jgi:hypothetical protein